VTLLGASASRILVFEFPSSDAAHRFFSSGEVLAGKVSHRVVEVQSWHDLQSLREAARELRGVESR
jgi:uncharacterized protein (DUF1330 family)